MKFTVRGPSSIVCCSPLRLLQRASSIVHSGYAFGFHVLRYALCAMRS